MLTVHNIRNYGAVGDGTTNDAPAIQAALNAARDDGAGIVYCPADGVYNVQTTLRIYRFTTFVIPFGATLRRGANVTIMINGDSSQNLGGYTGQGYITVCGGGTIDHRGTVFTNPNNCLTFAHAQNITVRDITIRDQSGYHAIELNAVKTARIEDVKFLGYVENGAGAFRECIQLDISKDAASTSMPPYDQYMCEDVLVSGCYAGISATSGVAAPSCLVGGHSATIGMRHKGVRVIGNRCDGLTYWAASGYAISGFVFANNQIINCAGGVRIDTVDTGDPDDTLNTSGTQTNASQDERSAVITGNTFLDTGTSGFHVIAVWGETTGKTLGATVSGNTIDGSSSGARAVYGLYAERLVVSGNQVSNTNGSGIYLDRCPDSTVTGNTVVAPSGTGIFVTASTGFTITGNFIRSTGDDAIQIGSSSVDFVVSSNTIRLAGQYGVNIINGCSDFTVANNTVRGASRGTTNTHSAFATSGTCTRGTWSGNRARRFTSGNDMKYAFIASASCSALKLFGNYWQAGLTAAVDNQSTSQDLTATDITA